MDATNTTPRVNRRSRRPQPRVRIPITIRYGLPLALLGGLIWLGFDAWRATRASIRFVDSNGAALAIEGGRVEFFVYRDDPWAPSPTERIGERPIAGTDSLTVGAELVPREALIRVEASDLGVGFGYVRLGDAPLRLELGPAAAYEGLLLGPDDRGVADALIEVFGGGARGVRLTEARSDEEGRFRVEGIADTVVVLTLRVRKPGFGTTSFDWPTNGAEKLVVRAQPTRPCRGRFLVDDPSRIAGLELRVMALPGVATTIREDGSFALNDLPAIYEEAHLVVPGLAGDETFRRATARAGDQDVRIELFPSQVVRGRVLNGYSERPVAGAAVSHEHGPRGEETVLCDSDGRFEIGRVPPGPVRFVASADVPRGSVPPAARPQVRSRRLLLQGATQLVVVPGDGVGEDLVIRIE